MGSVSVSLPSDGQTIDAADYNTPINTIVNEFNGGIDNTNIAAAAAIDGSKLATSSVGNTQLAVGVPVQVVSVAYSAVATGTTTIPNDDTVPQNTEGTEFMTLAITPKSATNMLKIELTAMLSHSAAVGVIGALFKDTTASAIAASPVRNTAAGEANTLSFVCPIVAGSTSEITFKFRAGGDGAGTLTFNGDGGARKLGAITKSSLVITEYKAV